MIVQKIYVKLILVVQGYFLNLGFTDANAKPWLPANPNFSTVNVDDQLKVTEASHTRNSHAAIYSFLVSISPTFYSKLLSLQIPNA
jgi:hypothetical protein